jgi:hypothetical protein
MLRTPGFILALVLLVSACDIFSFGARNRPESLRVVVTAEGLEPFALPSEAPLVTSRSFVFVVDQEGQGEIVLLSADTIMVDLPLDRTFEMAPNYNLLVRMLPHPDLPQETTPEEAPTYSMQAFVDGRESFSASRPMFPGSWIEFYVRHSL